MEYMYISMGIKIWSNLVWIATGSGKLLGGGLMANLNLITMFIIIS